MDNPDKLATLGTRHRQHWAHKTQNDYTLENTEGAIKNGQSRDTGNIEHKTQATLGTQDTERINVRK